jgi:hypothetical protein
MDNEDLEVNLDNKVNLLVDRWKDPEEDWLQMRPGQYSLSYRSNIEILSHICSPMLEMISASLSPYHPKMSGSNSKVTCMYLVYMQ